MTASEVALAPKQSLRDIHELTTGNQRQKRFEGNDVLPTILKIQTQDFYQRCAQTGSYKLAHAPKMDSRANIPRTPREHSALPM